MLVSLLIFGTRHPKRHFSPTRKARILNMPSYLRAIVEVKSNWQTKGIKKRFASMSLSASAASMLYKILSQYDCMAERHRTFWKRQLHQQVFLVASSIGRRLMSCNKLMCLQMLPHSLLGSSVHSRQVWKAARWTLPNPAQSVCDHRPTSRSTKEISS